MGLYVHIPFCETKCPYCDFNTYEKIEHLIPAYVDALVRELSLWSGLLDRPNVDTVFFGGGTPSYLPEEAIERLMAAIRSGFGVTSSAEVTLEANPGDLTPGKLEKLRESGINRLSIGVQSLSDRLLKVLGRRHDLEQAIGAFEMAVETGFQNASLDLMYGLPRQGIGDWNETLHRAVELGPPHLSMYCLTIEENTPMAQSVESGSLPSPDPDLAADMYETAESVMSAAGYGHYEISNWSRPGFESRHNMKYWRNLPYLGVGPGAHSYLQGHRFANLRSPRMYIERMEEASLQSSIAGQSRPGTIKSVPVVEHFEEIGQDLEMSETLMMGLRLDEGIVKQDFADRFGLQLSEKYGQTIADLDSLGLLDTSLGRLRLTSRGRLLGNEVFERFVQPAGQVEARA